MYKMSSIPRVKQISTHLRYAPTIQGAQFLSLGWECPLKKEMTTHSDIHAWEIPKTEESCELLSMGSQKSQTQLSNKTTIYIAHTHTHTHTNDLYLQLIYVSNVDAYTCTHIICLYTYILEIQIDTHELNIYIYIYTL